MPGSNNQWFQMDNQQRLLARFTGSSLFLQMVAKHKSG